MSRPIWKGHISFGLVNVPVVLYSAEHRTNISFKLIDSRNSARIRYERVNEDTGEEVPWNRIVKGYEYDDGNYVLLSDDELEVLVARIALYPDELVGLITAASLFPLQIVEASRFLDAYALRLLDHLGLPAPPAAAALRWEG